MSATRSPGFTPANARQSAGLRLASRARSVSGRLGSATAAAMFAGILCSAAPAGTARTAAASAAHAIVRILELPPWAPDGSRFNAQLRFGCNCGNAAGAAKQARQGGFSVGEFRGIQNHGNSAGDGHEMGDTESRRDLR